MMTYIIKISSELIFPYDDGHLNVKSWSLVTTDKDDKEIQD